MCSVTKEAYAIVLVTDTLKIKYKTHHMFQFNEVLTYLFTFFEFHHFSPFSSALQICFFFIKFLLIIRKKDTYINTKKEIKLQR